ncbi:hypothetical protein ACTHO5_05455 [Cytobacillus praedii]|uniref:hypothetical protein n=1 Tax=Cytobacillus praedii TaxID=1742358 RepID=UPI003F7DBA5A
MKEILVITIILNGDSQLLEIEKRAINYVVALFQLCRLTMNSVKSDTIKKILEYKTEAK